MNLDLIYVNTLQIIEVEMKVDDLPGQYNDMHYCHEKENNKCPEHIELDRGVSQVGISLL